jgi:transposase
MLHVGLDLSSRRVDVHVLEEDGSTVWAGPHLIHGDGLARLAGELTAETHEVRAVIESMTGARHVHDTLEAHGVDVRVADVIKAKGLAPLACKTDRIDAWVLAELSRRELIPEIWLPDFEVRGARERARFRLYLVRHRTSLKNRVHSTLKTHGLRIEASDIFGISGRQRLTELEIPEPWAGTMHASLVLIDDLDTQISDITGELRRLGADHPYVPLLETIPGIGATLGYTIAAEIGDIGRFASPKKLIGYTGLVPRVYQSGDIDRRGPITKHGPTYLRWALIEAAVHACRHPVFRPRYERLKGRVGKARGSKVAQTDLARRLAFAIWHMCTNGEPFAPAGAQRTLAA